MEPAELAQRLAVGTVVHLPERLAGNGDLFPAEDTVVIEAPHQNLSGIWVCRVARWPGTTVRVDELNLLND